MRVGLPTRWTRQPQYAVDVDRSHPWGREIFVGWNAATPTLMLSGWKLGTSHPGQWTRRADVGGTDEFADAKPNAFGVGIAPNGEGSGQRYTAHSLSTRDSPASTGDDTFWPGYTVVTAFVAGDVPNTIDASSSYDPAVFCWAPDANTSNSTFFTISPGFNSNVRTLRFSHIDGYWVSPTAHFGPSGSSAAPSADEWLPGEAITVVASWRRNFGAVHITAIRNGSISRRIMGDWNMRHYLGTTGMRFQVCGRGTGTLTNRTTNHSVSLAYAFRGYIEPGEGVNLARNPWQVFQPITRRIYSIPTSATGQLKVWDGSNWVAKPVKVWDGANWVVKPVKRWDGSSWVVTPY